MSVLPSYYSEAKLDEDKSKKLIVACSNAKRDLVEKLIEEDRNIATTINEVNNQGETAAHAAATGGDHYIIQMLLDNGADVHLSDKQGNTPLMRAAAMGKDNLEAVQVFLSHEPGLLFHQGTTGKTAYHCACIISDMDLLEHFTELDEDGRALKIADSEGNTPWLCAAMPPIKEEVLAYLLDHGAQINEHNLKHESALLLVARAGATRAIQFLLERGADPTLASSVGMTPLHEVALRKNVEGVRLLLAQPTIQIEAKTTAGETPLALACGGGSEECIRLLIEKGANFKDACIHSAAKYGRVEIVQLLLSKGVDINSEDQRGATPLICAVEGNQPEMIRFLCQNKCNINAKYLNTEYSAKPITAAQLAKIKLYSDCEQTLKTAKKEGCLVC